MLLSVEELLISNFNYHCWDRQEVLSKFFILTGFFNLKWFEFFLSYNLNGNTDAIQFFSSLNSQGFFKIREQLEALMIPTRDLVKSKKTNFLLNRAISLLPNVLQYTLKRNCMRIGFFQSHIATQPTLCIFSQIYCGTGLAYTHG